MTLFDIDLIDIKQKNKTFGKNTIFSHSWNMEIPHPHPQDFAFFVMEKIRQPRKKKSYHETGF